MIQYLLKGFLSVWHLLVRIFSYTFAESADLSADVDRNGSSDEVKRWGVGKDRGWMSQEVRMDV